MYVRGNICRSAMAEAYMKKRVKDENLSIQVFSCGLYAEDGDMATFNASEVMEEYGIDINNHRATNVENSEIEEMDLILCATCAHKEGVIELYPNLKSKVYTIKEYANFDKKDLDIKDPWGFSLESYKMCFLQIEECIENIIVKLKKQEKK